MLRDSSDGQSGVAAMTSADLGYERLAARTISRCERLSGLCDRLIHASWPTTGEVGTRDSETPASEGLWLRTYPPVGLPAVPVAHTGGGMQNGPVWRGLLRGSLEMTGHA
jgi:hypothetical protein